MKIYWNKLSALVSISFLLSKLVNFKYANGVIFPKEINAQRRKDPPSHQLIGDSFYDEDVQANPELALNYFVAEPRMNLYMKYSSMVYDTYLKYVSKEDIFVYSIDECFLDITSYLKLYKKTPIELAQTIIKDVYESTGITATAGIGTNLYLTKIALDITAKHVDSHIGYLDEKLYKETLWDHTPLTDFWQIGRGINNRLNKLGLHTMRDISNCNEDILYKEFGINAELLIDHANGKEDVTIKEIKQYKPKNNSLSNSQILFKDYNYIDARKVLIEMIDNLVLILVQKHLYTDNIGFYIGYSNDETSPTVYSHKLKNNTNSFSEIIDNILPYYDSLVKYNPIRRIGITFGNTKDKDNFQESIFDKTEYEKMSNAVNPYGDGLASNRIVEAIKDKRITSPCIEYFASVSMYFMPICSVSLDPKQAMAIGQQKMTIYHLKYLL